MLSRIAFALVLTIVFVACADPAAPSPTPTSRVPESTPTPRPTANVATVEPPAPPTSTWTPPDLNSITPRPTAPPVTEEPHPRLPIAGDIKLGDDGKYYAEVDGCRWDEFGRFEIGDTGVEEVGMQTPCLQYEGLHYVPTTGAVSYFIQ